MNSGKVVTVTLSPSLDRTLITHHLNLGYHNRVSDTTHLDASGRGVNVSRALSRLETPTHAIVLLGDDASGHAYRGLLSEEGFPVTVIKQPGPTRSDTIIVDRGSGEETHIIDEGSGGAPEDISRVLDRLKEVVTPGDMVVLAGLLPRDASPDAYLLLAQAAHDAGAHVISMTSGEILNQVLKAQPELIVLTRMEAESLFNYPVRTDADMISGSHRLRELGAGKGMLVSDDYDSIVLSADSGTWLSEISETGPGTDSGVVDALLAGYLAGLLQGMHVDDAFQQGAAAMNYADSQIGNVFGTPDEIRQYSHRVSVRSMETHGRPSVTSEAS